MVKLDELDISDEIRDWVSQDASRGRMVERVATALFEAWFPGNQPVGEDLENWIDCSVGDAYVSVRALVEGAWIDDPTMD